MWIGQSVQSQYTGPNQRTLVATRPHPHSCALTPMRNCAARIGATARGGVLELVGTHRAERSDPYPFLAQIGPRAEGGNNAAGRVERAIRLCYCIQASPRRRSPWSASFWRTLCNPVLPNP